ncbi:MAG TPA: epoxide hydrolase [Bryobacteraceae bacterium]|nr:epoxide hydrolase [Bryobacteraceae bacterium]
MSESPESPRPFRVNVPQKTIDDILTRVREARWPDRLEADDWRYGANWEYMKQLADYWTTRFDWRKAEARLNSFPQFLARVEDFDIHFYHVRGKGARPLPIVLTHGWPGSVVEFLDVMAPLSDPASHGGSAADAFDVIVPSLPGFGFSSKPHGTPVGPITTARLWHKLMRDVLGYSRYGAQGGDWGSAVTIQLARQFPGELAGIHLNAASARPSPEAQQSEEERAWVRAAAVYRDTEMDYLREQQRKPQTVAFALSGNPLGTAAWIIEKFKVWSDSGNDIEQAFTKDQLLTNVMLYLATGTEATGVWYYRGSADEARTQNQAATGKIQVPTGFAAFPKEMTALEPPRSVLERDYNLVHYTKMPRGGHFACMEQPALMVTDLRDFFRSLRG